MNPHHLVVFLWLSLISNLTLAQNTFEYKIQLKSELIPLDTLTLRGRGIDTSSVCVTVVDQNNDPYPFVKIKLQTADTTFHKLTNIEGEAVLRVPSNEYSITINSLPLETYISNLKLNHHEQIRLQFKAIQRHETLVIHSKIELTETDLERIKNCLLISDPKDCSNDNYIILIEI